MPQLRFAILVSFVFISLFLFGCLAEDGLAGTGSDGIPDSDIVDIQDLDVTTGQTIYVPAYSEVHYAPNNRKLDLAVTLSIHNTDFTHPIIITSVRYYSTQGELIKEFKPQPQRLGALASATYFVEANNEAGGVGTSFIVEWVAEQPVYEPVVETLMINTSNNQGLSFTSWGRVIKQILTNDSYHCGRTH